MERDGMRAQAESDQNRQVQSDNENGKERTRTGYILQHCRV